MHVSAILDSEEPPWDLNFINRWPFQPGKLFIRLELVYKLLPKMYKFQEWYMTNTMKGLEILCILARPANFATEGESVVWLEFKDIYDVYHLDALSTNLMMVT
jgi:hypothetical protein